MGGRRVIIVGEVYDPSLGIWGGPGPEQPPGGGGAPGYPAHPWVPPGGSPEHPWVPPSSGSPPGIWGPPGPWPTPPIYIPPGAIGGDPPRPTHPIYLPVYPAHPIVLPPPGEGGGGPEEPVLPPPTEGKMWVVVAIPEVGYKVVQVKVPPGYNPPPGANVPTPQGGRRR